MANWLSCQDSYYYNYYQVQIVNGEEENSEQSCAKLCSGSTGRSSTVFKDYSDGKNVYVDVDMSECGFVKIPNVVSNSLIVIAIISPNFPYINNIRQLM